MLKQTLLIIITMTFSFYSLMAIEIEEDGKTAPTSQPFVRKAMIYTFNEEGKMIGREDESFQSEEIFLEIDSLLKEESRIQSKLESIRSQRAVQDRRDDPATLLVTTPIICCYPCCILWSFLSEYFVKDHDVKNLMNEEVESKIKLRELDQQIRGLMKDIYLRTGRQHPKMRIHS